MSATSGPIKVMYVIDGLGTGGAQRSLAEALPGLCRAGIDPTVVVLHRKEEGVEHEIRNQGHDIHVLGGSDVGGRIVRLRALLRRFRPHIVHTTLFDSDLVGRVASMRTSASVVSSLVSAPYDAVRLEDPLVRKSHLEIARLIDGWTARRLTTHFHAISKAVKLAAIECLRIRPDRITVIERGRDASRLGEPSPERRARSRAALGLGEHERVVVTVGRQEFAKGHRYLIEAMALMRDRHDLVLLVAGRRGHASDDLVRLIRDRRIEDRVRMLGHRGDVPELLAAADVFAFPSLYEGLGGAVIEAMALALPVVASRLPAIQEFVEEGRNGTFVEPMRPVELATAISQFLDDPTRAVRFGANARTLFLERFTLERSNQRMIDLYHRVAWTADGGRERSMVDA